MKSIKFLTAGVLDQGLASLATLFVSLSTLRVANSDDAYSYSVGLIVFGLAVSVCRSVTSEPLAVFLDQIDPAKSAMRSHISVAALIAVLIFPALAILGALNSLYSVALSTTLFAVATADSVRSTLIAEGSSWRAAQRSILLSCGALVGAICGFAFGNVYLPILGWFVGSVCVLISGWISSTTGRILLRPHTFSYLLEFGVTAGASQAGLLLAVTIAGESLAISQRTLLTLFGPYLALYQAMALLGVPFVMTVLRKRRTGAQVALAGLLYSGVLLVALLAWALFAFAAARSLGSQLFGQSWEVSSPYFAVYLGALITGCFTAGLFISARATKNLKLSFSIRALSGALQLALPVTFAALNGIEGFFWGSLAASALIAVIGYILLLTWRERASS